MLSNLESQASQALDLALKGGADNAVVVLGDSRHTEFAYRDGKLEKVQQSSTRGLGLRLYVDGRYSTHTTSDLRPDQVRRFIDDAIALTRHLEPDPHRLIPDPELYTGRANVDLDLDDL